MFLQDRNSGDSVEILDIAALTDPNLSDVNGRFHAGEEMPEASTFHKKDLRFPSGEELPLCWKDKNYRS